MLEHNHDEIEEILSQYVNDGYRKFIEKNYYEKTNQRSLIENLIYDEVFLSDPQRHIALYDDHGVIHVRNIAIKILLMLEQLNGVLIPLRNRIRLEYMKGFGILVAYLHDAGMCICSLYGRLTHAEFIAQEVFKEHFAPHIDRLWDNNEINLRTKITTIIKNNQLKIRGKTLLREMLALSYCHSKSSVPGEMLNDLKTLKNQMKNCLSTTLSDVYLSKTKDKNINDDEHRLIIKNIEKERKNLKNCLKNHYLNFSEESYSWLDLPNKDDKEFIVDLIDTLRVLRCADALRQRGTALKTSGSYPIFLDSYSANSIYSFYMKSGENILLEIDNPINSGEANISSSEITPQGDLKFSFFIGAFKANESARKSAQDVAMIIEDVQRDVIDSLSGSMEESTNKTNILIEQTKDSYHYSEQIVEALITLEPTIADKVKIIPNFSNISRLEEERYFNSEDISNWPIEKLNNIIDNMEKTGLKKGSIDITKAFKNVRYTILQPDECLFKGLDSSEFTYIPFCSGLEGVPNGGYSHFSIKEWTFVGHIGLIRNAERNATVTAKKQVPVLMIQRSVFLKHWYKPYSEKEFLNYIEDFKKHS